MISFDALGRAQQAGGIREANRSAAGRSKKALGESNPLVTNPPQWALVTSRRTSWAKATAGDEPPHLGAGRGQEKRCPLTWAKTNRRRRTPLSGR